uniref:Uncharacterized protein n=1 Tax=Hemiselmis tepida TaxID=464990 RepID=A0A7S0YLI3_9CRYP|mmetsp:Transcript_16370/g.41467  ORF Transcript_16370/g.41467 Transcript_16370/m.41467 type:complete len:312 (+) Transcript_16370:84-1019(+)
MARTVSCRRGSAAAAVAVLLACVFSMSSGFALRGGWQAPGAGARGPVGGAAACRGGARGALAARAQLDAVEAKAVQRFTKSYDKLCKTCPTRLQPRVDTLEEMIVGLPEDELKLLAAKVALRLSGHDGAALAAGLPGAAAVGGGMAALAAPAEHLEVEGSMGMDKAMPENKDKMTGKEDKMAVEIDMSKAEKKRAKLERKVQEREMDRAVYHAELKFLEHLDGAAAADAQVKPEEAAAKFLEVPASCEGDRMEMEKKLQERCAEAAMMTAEKREIRSLKVQEKVLKCTRKIKECSAELAMLASPAMAAPAC